MEIDDNVFLEVKRAIDETAKYLSLTKEANEVLGGVSLMPGVLYGKVMNAQRLLSDLVPGVEGFMESGT